MIPYISPEFTFSQLVKAIIHRKKEFQEFYRKTSEEGAKSIYIREKQRYALADFLNDVGMNNQRVLVPAFTCRSVADAVREANAIPVYYDITPNLEVDLVSIEKAAKDGVEAIIVSDIYGKHMDIYDWLDSLVERPVVIGDFAHHDEIRLTDVNRPYFDVVMYSSAYYKPMRSMGFGLLCLLTDKVQVKDSILISTSIVSATFGTLKIWLTSILLKSFLFNTVYKLIQLINKKIHVVDVFDSKRPANIAAFSQYIRSSVPDKKERNLIAEYYKKMLPSLTAISGGGNETYYSVLIEPDIRNNLHKEALKQGVFLGNIISDIACTDEKECPNAMYLSKRITNLPFLCCINKYKKVTTIIKRLIN